MGYNSHVRSGRMGSRAGRKSVFAAEFRFLKNTDTQLPQLNYGKGWEKRIENFEKNFRVREKARIAGDIDTTSQHSSRPTSASTNVTNQSPNPGFSRPQTANTTNPSGLPYWDEGHGDTTAVPTEGVPPPSEWDFAGMQSIPLDGQQLQLPPVPQPTTSRSAGSEWSVEDDPFASIGQDNTGGEQGASGQDKPSSSRSRRRSRQGSVSTRLSGVEEGTLRVDEDVMPSIGAGADDQEAGDNTRTSSGSGSRLPQSSAPQRASVSDITETYKATTVATERAATPSTGILKRSSTPSKANAVRIDSKPQLMEDPANDEIELTVPRRRETSQMPLLVSNLQSPLERLPPRAATANLPVRKPGSSESRSSRPFWEEDFEYHGYDDDDEFDDDNAAAMAQVPTKDSRWPWTEQPQQPQQEARRATTAPSGSSSLRKKGKAVNLRGLGHFIREAALRESAEIVPADPLAHSSVELRPPVLVSGEKHALSRGADFFHDRGFGHRTKGDFQAAVLDYRKAIQVNPNHFKAHFNCGFLYDRMGEPHKAIEHFSRSIEIDPENAYALYNRGSVYTSIGEVEKAVEDFTKAIEIEPGNPNFLKNRGFSHRKLGNFQEAISDYTVAASLVASIEKGGEEEVRALKANKSLNYNGSALYEPTGGLVDSSSRIPADLLEECLSSLRISPNQRTLEQQQDLLHLARYLRPLQAIPEKAIQPISQIFSVKTIKKSATDKKAEEEESVITNEDLEQNFYMILRGKLGVKFRKVKMVKAFNVVIPVMKHVWGSLLGPGDVVGDSNSLIDADETAQIPGTSGEETEPILSAKHDTEVLVIDLAEYRNILDTVAEEEEEEKIAFLHKLTFFESFMMSDLARIAEIVHPTRHVSGKVIVHQGDMAEGVYFVTSGRLRVFKHKDGKDLELGTLGPRDYFGEESILGTSDYSTINVLCLTTVKVLFMHRTDFRRRLTFSMREIIRENCRKYMGSLTNKRKEAQSQQWEEYKKSLVADVLSRKQFRKEMQGKVAG